MRFMMIVIPKAYQTASPAAQPKLEDFTRMMEFNNDPNDDWELPEVRFNSPASPVPVAAEHQVACLPEGFAVRCCQKGEMPA